VLDRQDLLKVLEAFDGQAWEGFVWRHMFGKNPPSRANQLGARWNPPGSQRFTASLDRTTVLAEGDYAVSVQPLRPTVKRTIYKLHVRLENVLDLSSVAALLDLGIDQDEISNDNHLACQTIGGAIEWLEHDGMLVPSARSSGRNLVVFPRHQTAEADFEVISSELVG